MTSSNTVVLICCIALALGLCSSIKTSNSKYRQASKPQFTDVYVEFYQVAVHENPYDNELMFSYNVSIMLEVFNPNNVGCNITDINLSFYWSDWVNNTVC